MKASLIQIDILLLVCFSLFSVFYVYKAYSLLREKEIAFCYKDGYGRMMILLAVLLSLAFISYLIANLVRELE